MTYTREGLLARFTCDHREPDDRCEQVLEVQVPDTPEMRDRQWVFIGKVMALHQWWAGRRDGLHGTVYYCHRHRPRNGKQSPLLPT
ncbi:MAG: hypothetical protein GY929_08965 [Actinomycetia bacterium]|nr:hypothetical protein [Actinomycetes bacterium]